MTTPFLEEHICDKITISYDEYKNEDRLKSILDEYGFAIVTDILTNEEQHEAELLMRDDLLNSIDYDNILDNKLYDVIKKIKLNKNNLEWPRSSIPGIIQKGFMSLKGIPQGQFAWKLRLNEKCKKIYQHLHNEEHVTVSFDLPFFSPYGAPIKSPELWPHADQNLRYEQGCKNSYQGILYVWDSTGENTSNTTVWSKTWNKEYHTLLNNIPTSDNHGVNISAITDEKIKKEMMDGWKLHSRRVPVIPGSLLIFNSRTIHQGYSHGTRLAQTLAWEPKMCRSNKSKFQKIDAIYKGYGTTHWASLGIHHGASTMSCRKNKNGVYSNDFHLCIIPMKNIKPIPLIDDIDEHTKLIKDYKTLIKNEYLDCI